MQFLNKPTFRIYHSVNPDGPLIGNKSVSKLIHVIITPVRADLPRHPRHADIMLTYFKRQRISFQPEPSSSTYTAGLRMPS